MTNTNAGFTIINPDRRLLALVSLKHRLKLEIETGMNTSSRIGLVNAARNWGYEGTRSKKACLKWVLEQLDKTDSEND